MCCSVCACKFYYYSYNGYISYLLRRQCPPRGKSKEGASQVYDIPDSKLNVPTNTSNIEMLSYKKPADRESLIYDIPVTTTTDNAKVQESLIYDLPMATTTSDDVITVQNNASYTVFKK